MYQYRLAIQFAMPSAPCFDKKIMDEVKLSIEHYNARSLIARNPKRIIDPKVSDSGRTLELTIESEAVLTYPGRALRLFSEFLATDPGALNQYIYNHQRRLFKMTVISSSVVSPPSDPGERMTLSEDITLLKNLLDLILADDRETLSKIKNIMTEGENHGKL